MSDPAFPNRLHSEWWPEGHVQGIAVDEARGFVYFSFTTILLKTDYAGNPVGSVKNIVGHLGCITFDPDRRRVYGSLELKHDAIGAGIVARTGRALAEEDAFYCVSFDCDRITRPDMDAEADGVMTAVYLPDVVRDYSEHDEATGALHRYGCSGIDGTALGPTPGAAPDEPPKIHIAYGIYGDTSRSDNDYQVILAYDPAMFDTYGRPLSQAAPHHSGPAAEARYFFKTGNTVYGVQNLEYDPYTRTYLAAVYPGHKLTYPNDPLFFIDATVAPTMQPLDGRPGESGLCLTAAHPHPAVQNPYGGSRFSLGQTGVYAFGDGRYAYSIQQDRREAGRTLQASEVVLYRFDPAHPLVFTEA